MSPYAPSTFTYPLVSSSAVSYPPVSSSGSITLPTTLVVIPVDTDYRLRVFVGLCEFTSCTSMKRLPKPKVRRRSNIQNNLIAPYWVYMVVVRCDSIYSALEFVASRVNV